MKFDIEKFGIKIIPENAQDEAYIEDTLNLRNKGDTAPAIRQNVVGLSHVAYVVVQKQSPGDDLIAKRKLATLAGWWRHKRSGAGTYTRTLEECAAELDAVLSGETPWENQSS